MDKPSKPGTFRKGDDPRRAPGGFTPERTELRRALEADGDKVHAALMRLVDADNAQAIIYAHTQLIGKPKDRVEVSGDAAAQAWLGQLTAAQVLAIARGDAPKDGDE